MINNDAYLGSKDAIKLIDEFVSDKLPDFKMVKHYDSGFGYWGVVYQSGNNRFELKSDRGALEMADIVIGASNYWVGDFDKSLNDGIEVNERSLLKVLDAIFLILS